MHGLEITSRFCIELLREGDVVNRNRSVDTLAVKAGLPGEVLPGQTLIELLGRKRVLIENHKGLICYNGNRIVVRGLGGAVCICGCEMKIVTMTNAQLVICGEIRQVTLGEG